MSPLSGRTKRWSHSRRRRWSSGRRKARSLIWCRQNGAHHQGVHGTIEDPGGHLRQLPGTNLLEGTEVCCRRGQCPHSCGATIGGSDVLGPLRDGCSNGLPAGAFAVPGGPTYLGSGTEDVRDGRSVQGDHLESEASSLWNGDFPSILGGLSQPDHGPDARCSL